MNFPRLYCPLLTPVRHAEGLHAPMTAVQHIKQNWSTAANPWHKAIAVPAQAGFELTRASLEPLAILTDRLACMPVNAVSLLAAAVASGVGASIGCCFVQPNGRSALGVGALIGANVGVAAVRFIGSSILNGLSMAGALTVGLVVGVVALLVSPVSVALLAHGKTDAAMSERLTADVKTPMVFTDASRSFARTWVRQLCGQGDRSQVSLENFQIHPGDGNTDTITGEIRTLFCMKKVNDVRGILTYDADDNTRRLQLSIPEGIFNPIDIDATPTLCADKLHLTGTANGFHYAEVKPIDTTLAARGFRRSTSPESKRGAPVVSFTKAATDGGDDYQALHYGGPWGNGYSMGAVQLHQFSLATAARLGMGLELSC